MKKLLFKTFLFALFFGIIPISSLTQEYQLEFIIDCPTLKNSDTVFITGNRPELGMWNTALVPMNLHTDGSRSYTLLVPKNTIVEYKFTLGSWNTEAVNDSGLAFQNFSTLVLSDTIIRLQFNNWTKKESVLFFKGQVTGNVHKHTEFVFNTLKPRDIIVWLPPAYDTDSAKRYPVLYMQDGQNLFNPATSFTGIDWQIDEAADSLLQSKQIEPLIVVGINNTDDRMKEYVPSTLSEDYMKLVVSVIKPFIDKHYRTLADKENTRVGGSSAGGTISFMLAWKYDTIFVGALCLSPAFLIDSIDCISMVKNYSGKSKSLHFYFDNGGQGIDSLLQPGLDEMINALTAKGYREGTDFFTEIDRLADHTEKAWAHRFPYILLKFYGRKDNFID